MRPETVADMVDVEQKYRMGPKERSYGNDRRSRDVSSGTDLPENATRTKWGEKQTP